MERCLSVRLLDCLRVMGLLGSGWGGVCWGVNGFG